jgi:stearoyl-CoA desaturase (delta-9 desaturase)
MELKRADAATRKLLRQAKLQMMRDHVLSDEGARLVLSSALAANSTLATVYQFKVQLRELWSNAQLTQEKQLGALHEWCCQAETTSIQFLQDFTGVLRGYSMVPRI